MRLRSHPSGSSALGLAAVIFGGLVVHAPDARAANAFDTMVSDPRFSIWVEMLQQGGMAPRAANAAPYTVFVPVNEAWTNIPSIIKDELLPRNSATFPDTSKLNRVVRSHAVSGFHQPEELTGKKTTLVSVNGLPIQVDGTDATTTVTFAGAKGHIVGKPIVSDNAIIYPVDLVAASFP